MSKFLQILLIVFLNLIFINEIKAQEIKLHGVSDKKNVKLFWEIHEWPSDLYGFNIKRKEAGSNEWVKLNIETISPQINRNMSWSNLGLNDKQIKEILKSFDSYIESNAFSELTNKEFLYILKNKGGLKSGDRIRLKNDFDLALIFGFAYIDNFDEKKKKYVYGLFSVNDKEDEINEPIAEYSEVDTDKLNIQLVFDKLSEGISVSWRVSKKDVSQMGFFGFNIYRSNIGLKSFEKLNNTVMGSIKEYTDSIEWVFKDEKIDNTKDYIYAISPVNMFQTELKKYEKRYRAEDFNPVFISPIDTIFIVNDVDLKLVWKNNFTKKGLKNIKSFKVERADVRNELFEAVSPDLSVNTEQFVDTIKKDYLKKYLYRLACEDISHKKWYSKITDIVYQGVAVPKQPSGFNAEFKMSNDKPFVVLSWDKKQENDTLTKGYLIATDELNPGGDLLLDTEISLILKNRYVYIYKSNGGEKIKFSLIPVSYDNYQGHEAFAECEIPLINLPLITDFNVSIIEDLSLKFSWKYEDSTNVNFFNIIMNGDIIVKELSPEKREYILKNINNIKPGKNVFWIQAVGEISSVESLHKSFSSLYEKFQKKDIYIPKKLKAKIKKKDNDVFVRLKWNSIDLEKEKILGYILYVDETSEGILNRKMSIPLIKQNEYLYKLKNNDRNEYTFAIAAMDINHIVGNYKKIKVKTVFKK